MALGRAAELLRGAELVPILCAPDADSVLGAGIVGLALRKAGIPWHVQFAAGLEASQVAKMSEEAPGQPLLLVGLGGREPDALGALAGAEAILLDPYWPRLAGSRAVTVDDAANSPTASTLAFDLSRALDPQASALRALAGLEAAGPLEGSDGLQHRLIEEAQAAGAKPAPTPTLPPGPLVEALAASRDPFLPTLSGRARACKKFLEAASIPPSAALEDLSPPQAAKLTNALALHLLARGAAAAAPRSLATPDVRAAGPGGGARALAALCQACVAAGRPGLALVLALGDPKAETEALALAEARAQRLLQALVKLEGDAAEPRGLGPLRADADLAEDLAWQASVSFAGGEPVVALGAPGRLHVAAPLAEPRFLGQASWEAAQECGGTGRTRRHRATLEVPAGREGEVWQHLRRRLGVVA